MGKDPAFLFYPGDWLGGTMGMTFEQKGAYIELLMMQFNRGHMTTHMVGQAVGQHWVTLQDKFIQDKDGLWYNVRLDEEKEKRKNFVSSRNNNINGENQYSKAPKKIGHKTKHMTSHMENGDVNENEIEKGNEFENYIAWTNQILDRACNIFQVQMMNEHIPESPNIDFWVRDHLGLLERYPKMRPQNQQRFVGSVMKHIRENYKKPINGNGLNKNTNHVFGVVKGIAERYGKENTEPGG